MSYFTIPELTSIPELASYLNEITGNFFWGGILCAIFAVGFINQSRYGISSGLSTSFFVTFVASVLFATAGLVGWHVVVALMTLTAIVAFME